MASLRFGLVYDLLGTYPRRPGDPDDVDAEYEPEETVCALEAAVRRLGHLPVRIGSPSALLSGLAKGELPTLDVAMTIAEGYGGRNREAWAPVLLEMAGVPTLGSDALTLSATLDKAWASALVAASGVRVPDPRVLRSGAEARALAPRLDYPRFAKPRWEGTAKGIRPSSRIETPEALVAEVERIVGDYAQPALVERFLPGAEYTLTLVGNAPPRVLPALQRALERSTGIGLHALDGQPAPQGEWRAVLPGRLSPELEDELASLARRAYEALECRDFARADFRLDAQGRPHFLEMNPLPTFATDGTFGILAELEGRAYEELVAEVLEAGLVRLGLASIRGA